MKNTFRQLNQSLVIAVIALSLGLMPLMASAAVVKPAGRKLPVKIARKIVPAPVVAKVGKVNNNLPGHPVIFAANPVINVPSLASPTAPIKAVPTGRVYAKAVINDQPITLTGDEVMEISNTNFLQKHNIILKDRSQLIIKDSQFEQQNSRSVGHYLEARDFAQIKITNSDLRFSPGTTWRITDHASLNYSGSSMAADATSGIVWHEVTKEAKVDVYGTPFHASVTDRVQITIDRSPDVFLDLNVNGAIMNEDFPRAPIDYVFPGHNDHNIYFKIKITNSVAYRWGIKLSPVNDVTINNTDGVNIGLVFGWPLENATIALDGLKVGKFEDRIIVARQMKLRLINTTVTEWIPVVGDNNTLQIKNAALASQQWDWGWANVVLENCVIPSARAKNNVTMTLKDCAVNGDVTALDDGKIILINTTVAGQKVLRGNGQIKEQ
ncbi:MAG: hypothetical protein EXS55_03275 [Candidatus Magasanikbacteria bacterium]|nr:hypothetical protein [Candidatus Magasanikbacteria bacterium]